MKSPAGEGPMESREKSLVKWYRDLISSQNDQEFLLGLTPERVTSIMEAESGDGEYIVINSRAEKRDTPMKQRAYFMYRVLKELEITPSEAQDTMKYIQNINQSREQSGTESVSRGKGSITEHLARITEMSRQMEPISDRTGFNFAMIGAEAARMINLADLGGAGALAEGQAFVHDEFVVASRKIRERDNSLTSVEKVDDIVHYAVLEESTDLKSLLGGIGEDRRRIVITIRYHWAISGLLPKRGLISNESELC
jgi:hypothetical protein